jgi:hypothetical protein
MSKVWEKFDKLFDTESLVNDVEEAKENNTSFKEVPHGTYEVSVEKLELVASKAGDPMVTCWFNVLEGEYKGSKIFMNQVITKGFQIHIANEFLRSLESGQDIEFKSYSQYGELLMDVLEAVDGTFEYSLKYEKGKKDFSTYEIADVFEVE